MLEERRLPKPEMWVRVLPIAQQRKGTWMVKCDSHKIVKGLVERSMKEEETVIRKRRCGMCGELVKTIEMTEEKLEFRQERFEKELRVIRAELIQYKNLVDGVKRMYDAEKRVRSELKIEQELREMD